MGVRGGRWTLLAAAWAAVALTASPALHAQDGAVRGVVEADRTLRPVSGALVEAVGTGRTMVTDANGRFMLIGLPGGQVTLRVSLLGYRTAERR
jgi:hypothetical protein